MNSSNLSDTVEVIMSDGRDTLSKGCVINQNIGLAAICGAVKRERIRKLATKSYSHKIFKVFFVATW